MLMYKIVQKTPLTPFPVGGFFYEIIPPMGRRNYIRIYYYSRII